MMGLPKDLHEAYIQPQPYKKPPFSIESPGYEKVEGETIPRRHPKCVKGLSDIPAEGVTTIYEVLLRSAELYGDSPACGTRPLIKTHHEIKKLTKLVEGHEEIVEKKWTFFELGDYEYTTYNQYKRLALELGSGLRNLGLKKDERIHIFAGTSMSWMAMAHAACSQTMPVVTSYATLGEEGLEMSLSQTSAKAIFVDPDLILKLIQPINKAPDVKYLIYNTHNTTVRQSDLDMFHVSHDNIKLISLDELRASGEANPVDAVPPQPDDLACIMYTSGTTGTPKGVELSHRNVVAAVAGLECVFQEYVGHKDTVLTYLPLAHSFEFAFENACFYWGLKMGYGNPRTLSDGSMKNCKGDIKTFKPTILIGVPAVWEVIRKGIEAQVAKQSFIARNVFWGAMSLKAFLCQRQLPGPGLIDALVFNKVKSETGGRLRVCFNGAGPLVKETRRFISFAIAPLIIGYGLTETMAMGAIQDPFEWTDDTLGSMPGCVEVKLVDYPDAGYYSTNDPPQGEIYIHGDAVTKGYYKNDTENALALAPGGWFRTGDIGEWAPNGHLKCIDRKKNLVKTLNGEYIALEKLEAVYRSNNIVSNICIFAADDKARPIAIVIPNVEALKIFARENGVVVDGRGFDEIVRDEKVHGLFLKDLQAAGAKAGLAHFEIIEGLVLTESEWTTQNGALTPAQKLNRRKVVPMYTKEIDVAYGRVKKTK
jgi:long-chain acyl-CoA synthetase